MSRAKKSLFKPPAALTSAQAMRQRQVVQQFVAAIRVRDVQQVEHLMAADIRFYANGGGTAPMAAGTCIGATDVARLEVSIYERFLNRAVLVQAVINHQPAIISFVDGRLTACQVFDLHPGTVIYSSWPRC